MVRLPIGRIRGKPSSHWMMQMKIRMTNCLIVLILIFFVQESSLQVIGDEIIYTCVLPFHLASTSDSNHMVDPDNC